MARVPRGGKGHVQGKAVGQELGYIWGWEWGFEQVRSYTEDNGNQVSHRGQEGRGRLTYRKEEGQNKSYGVELDLELLV